jgi:hypothetical protein
MIKKAINASSFLVYRMTPWDERAFGFKTCEIMEISYDSIDNLRLLFQSFEEDISPGGIKFTYTRIDAQDLVLKKYLQEAGFYYVETTFLITLDLQKNDFSAAFKNNLCLEAPLEEDYAQLKNLARDSFKYGRFHEDANISGETAGRRYYCWIDDLRAQGKKFLIHKDGGEVKAFVVYDDFSSDRVCVIVVGSKSGKGFLTYYLIPSFCTFLKNSGHNKAYGMISAANLGMIMLYARLNIKFEKTLLGFHKFYA